MWVSRLMLANYRNYRRLGLELQAGIAIFHGANGQGKTNLLEAVYVLATTRSPRTSNERELVSWQAPDDVGLGMPAFTRLEGRVHRGEGDVRLEVVLKGEPQIPNQSVATASTTAGEVTGSLGRSIKVNELPTRATGLIGQLPVVYFAPEDVQLAGGAPSARRQYLNVANSQAAPLYLRTLQQYNRILSQRNNVLRQVRERRQARSALDPWTDQLVRTGAFLVRNRRQMLAGVNGRAASIFRDLSGTDSTLEVVYRSSLQEGGTRDGTLDLGAIAHQYRLRQEQVAGREVEQAVSLVGPHRDDFSLMLNDIDLNTYGSRGQQRLAVIAMKLAEADWMCAEIGEIPVLLLDDVLSELDQRRRRYVLDHVLRLTPAAPASRQVWITATDVDEFSSDLLEAAQRFRIDGGTVRIA